MVQIDIKNVKKNVLQKMKSQKRNKSGRCLQKQTEFLLT